MRHFLIRLLGRWDLAVDERLALPFDQGIAIVNLRRMEIACLLGFVTDLLQLSVGPSLPSIVAGAPLEILFLLLANIAQRRFSPSNQRALVLLFFAMALLDRLWGTSTLALQGRLVAGYSIVLLSLTVLFAVPPRSFAIVNAAGLAAYCLLAMVLPLPVNEKIVGVADTAMVAAICQVADWLIYNSRRSDHDQRLVIRAQNQRLTEQNRELDELMAVTAHDLRSPLYGLRNLLDLALRRTPEKPDLPARVMSDAIFSLDAMIVLVTRLLDAHAAEHRPLGSIAINDLCDPIRAAIRRIGPQAEAAAVPLLIDLPEEGLKAQFDESALAQILDNLLGNAVRFSSAAGIVTVSARKVGGHAQIEVEDNGPGIAPTDRPDLFEKFRRAGDSQKAGTGMGLFIAATLAERVGATLTHRPANAGGSIFQIRFPAIANGND